MFGTYFKTLLNRSVAAKQAYLKSTAKINPSNAISALPHADVLYHQWLDINWTLCRYILGSLPPCNDGILQTSINHPQRKEILQYVTEFSELVVGSKLIRGLQIKHVSANDHTEGFERSYYTDSENTAYLRDNPDRGVVWHELGHVLEHKVPGAADAALAFLRLRTKGQQPEKLNVLQGPGHASDEEAIADSFIQPYMGKLYKKERATELTSMGLQFMSEDPATLYLQDRSMFDFTLQMVRLARGKP